MIVAEDANSKQKACLHASDAMDPALGPGWGTFVNSKQYFQHLSKYVTEDEVNTSLRVIYCGLKKFTTDQSLRGVCSDLECKQQVGEGIKGYGNQVGDIRAA